MLDYQTGSYWWQVAGEAVVGPLTEEKLTVLPSMTTMWGAWRELHPTTLALSRDTGFSRDYSRDPFRTYSEIVNSGRFAFPVSEASKDGRLQPANRVLAVKVDQDARAYPVVSLGHAAIMDTVGDQSIVVFTDPDSRSGSAYEPIAAGRALTFEMREGEFTDRETDSTWNLAGQAVRGPLQGAQLSPIPSRTSFWFAIVAAEPEIIVFQTSGE